MRARENAIKPEGCIRPLQGEVSLPAYGCSLLLTPAMGGIICLPINKHILARLTLFGNLYWNCFSYHVRNVVHHSVFSSATKSLLRIWNILKSHSITVTSPGAQGFTQQHFHWLHHSPLLCRNASYSPVLMGAWWGIPGWDGVHGRRPYGVLRMKMLGGEHVEHTSLSLTLVSLNSKRLLGLEGMMNA